MQCPNCKNEISDSSRVCDFCGERIRSKGIFGKIIQLLPKKGTLYRTSKQITKSLGDFCKRRKTLLAISLFAIALVVVLMCFFFGKGSQSLFSGSQSGFATYLSKDGLHFLECNTKSSVLLFNGAIPSDEAKLYTPSCTTVSKDGAELLFLKNLSENPDNQKLSGDLCLWSLDEGGSSGQIVASRVTNYLVNEDFSRILYEQDSSLYEYDVDEEKSLCIASIDSFENVKLLCEDSYVYLTSKGNLFEKPFGEKEKLADEGVTSFCVIYGSDLIYYEKESDFKSEFRLKDYVEFDVDATKTQEKPEYPKKGKMSDEEYKEVYDNWSEQYNSYLEYESERETVLALVDDLEHAVYTPDLEDGSALYEYEEGKTQRVCDYGSCFVVKNKLCYRKGLVPKLSEKVKLSQITSVDDVKKYIDENLEYEYWIGSSNAGLPKGSVILDASEELDEILYVVPGESDDISCSVGDLYTASYTEGEISTHSLLDTDVCVGEIQTDDGSLCSCNAKYVGSKIAYYKNCSGSTFDYYEDKSLIYSKGVFGHKYDAESHTLAYLKRPVFSGNKLTEASLVMLKDGVETEIFRGEVEDFCPMSDGSVVFSVKGKGEMLEIYRFDQRMPELVCDNAKSFVTTSKAHMDNGSINCGLYICDEVLYIITDKAPETVAEGVSYVAS